MNQEDVLRQLRQRPFRPFKILVTDGAVYEIRHPDQIMLTRSSLLIPASGPGQGAEESSDTEALLHITRLLPVIVTASASKNGE
ncbi:MAG: hypothetical protein ACJ8FY_23510 [Gemmataceae bacterium]